VVFPLSEVCSTVGASSLPQGKTADEPKWEQDDGQEDAQEGEGVLQNPDSADWAASNDDDGIGRVPGDISTVDVVDPGVVGGYPTGKGRSPGRPGESRRGESPGRLQVVTASGQRGRGLRVPSDPGSQSGGRPGAVEVQAPAGKSRAGFSALPARAQLMLIPSVFFLMN